MMNMAQLLMTLSNLQGNFRYCRPVVNPRLEKLVCVKYRQIYLTVVAMYFNCGYQFRGLFSVPVVHRKSRRK